MGKRTLLLIRHGHYQGENLSALGKRQARRLATRMKNRGLDAIHVSTLPRALQTAELICARLPDLETQEAEILCEIVPTRPPMLPDFLRGRPEARFEADRFQAEQVIARYFRPSSGECTEAVVCHGNLIRFLLTRVLERPDDTWITYGIHHCGITEVCVGEDGTRTLITYNDTGHLSHDIRTG